jgi:alpha 1,3-mannosyltransferase
MSSSIIASVSMHRYRSLFAALGTVLLLFAFWASPWELISKRIPARAPAVRLDELPKSISSSTPSYLEVTGHLTDYFEAYPLPESEFGQMGKRLQILKDWIRTYEGVSLRREEGPILWDNIERFALSLTPFLRNPSKPEDRQPLRSLRHSFVPNSRGIVISTGRKRFRFACHLIRNLREVLGSTLPIQVAYAGDHDLPADYRKYLTSMGPDITTFDVTSIFDDRTLKLASGNWAIKPFTLLGSAFEQAMLLDADAVFLQKPENIFEVHPGYRETGTLLFHDRLLWQGAFKERHEWWEKELAHTELSATIRHSKVYVDKYAEEGDSGVVVVDKGRLDVFVGLLHICWQNTYQVREAFTYRQGYGDKESWWFGFELTATPYTMEEHYGAIVGHSQSTASGKGTRVCSFTIAHVDHNNKLLWYNGSLLKNKEIDPNDFDVPTEWMIDGVWEKGATKQNMSCMRDAEIRSMQPQEIDILQKTVDAARQVDSIIRDKIPGSAPR